MKRWVTFWFLVQLIGAFFYCVLSAAYFLPFPSTQILIGEPIFRTLLTAIGSLYLVITLVLMIIFKTSKRK